MGPVYTYGGVRYAWAWYYYSYNENCKWVYYAPGATSITVNVYWANVSKKKYVNIYSTCEIHILNMSKYFQVYNSNDRLYVYAGTGTGAYNPWYTWYTGSKTYNTEMLYLNWRSDGHGNAKGIRVTVTRNG